jgi:hypothetical protein
VPGITQIRDSVSWTTGAPAPHGASWKLATDVACSACFNHDRVSAGFFRSLVGHGENRHPVCAGTTTRGEFPPGIGYPHDYAILDYHAETDSVTLWNPQGSNFEPKGAPGLTNGYSMLNGQLRIPSHDFTLIFGAMFIETPGGVNPVKQRAR